MVMYINMYMPQYGSFLLLQFVGLENKQQKISILYANYRGHIIQYQTFQFSYITELCNECKSYCSKLYLKQIILLLGFNVVFNSVDVHNLVAGALHIPTTQ